MAKKEEELYKEWVAEIEGKLKTDEEKSAFAIFSQSEAGRENLRGGIRRAEFDRRLNELHEAKRQVDFSDSAVREKKAVLDEWYEKEAPKNQALIAELQTLKSRLKEVTGDDPPPAALTEQQQPFKNEEFEALKREFAALNNNLPRIMGDMYSTVQRSLKEDINLDPREVIAYSIKHHVDPFRAYEDLTHETRAERFEKEREKALADAREEGRREALKQVKSSPDHIRTPGPNVVDFLRKEAVPQNRHDRIAASVADFLEMGSPTI